MNAKNTILKILASLIITYMVMNSFLVTLFELGKVIAEEVSAQNIKVASSLFGYTKYSRDNYKGVILKQKINVSEECTQESYQKIEKMSIEIKSPSINGLNPKKAIIEELNINLAQETKNLKYNYDSNTGILSISYESKEKKEYQENIKDEIEIIYIYPEEAIMQDDEEKEIQSIIKIKAKEEKNKEEITKQEIVKAIIGKSEDKLIEYEKQRASNIYKGFMYQNQTTKTKYETEYETYTKLEVNNSEIIDELKINLNKSAYLTSQNAIVPTDTIIYHVNKINENEFNKIFGTDGYIEFYTNGEKYAVVRYKETDKNCQKEFVTEYITEQKNTEAGIVEYKEGTDEVEIKTSKPIAEGKLNIYTKKKILARENYGLDVQSIQKVVEQSTIEALKNEEIETEQVNENGEKVKENKVISIDRKESKQGIELKENNVQMSLELSNDRLSTISNNKITATVKLNDTNSSCKLFSAGEMRIKLPDNLSNIKISEIKMLYANGLKLENAKLKDGYIIINITGKQEAYDLENIAGGVNIVFDLEIDIKDTVTTHEENIDVIFNGYKTSKKVNIVSKDGVVVLNKLNGYENGKELYSIDEMLKNTQVAMQEKEKTMVQDINILNNYEQSITDLKIYGVLGDISEAYRSNFNLKLQEQIKNNNNIKVLYSTDLEKHNWSEEFTKDAKEYLLEIKELKAKEHINLQLILKLNENLTYNMQSYLKTEISYIYDNNKMSKSSILGLYTEMNEAFENYSEKINAVSNEDIYTELKKIYGDQIEVNSYLKSGAEKIPNETEIMEDSVMNYVVEVKNNSNQMINNLKIIGDIPEGAKKVTLKNDSYLIGDDFFDIDEQTKQISKTCNLNAGEITQLEYSVMFNKYENIKDKKIVQTSNVYINNQLLATKKLTHVVQRAEILIRMNPLLPTDNDLYAGDTFEISVTLKNLTDKTITGDLDILFSKYNKISDIKYYIPNTFEDEYSEKEISGKNIMISAKQTLNVLIAIEVKEIEDVNILKEDFELSAKFKANNKTYSSNVYDKEIKQTNTKITATMQGYVNNKERETESTISKKDKVMFLVNVKNEGKLNGDVYLYNKLSDRMYSNKVDFNGKEEILDEEYYVYDYFEIKPGETYTYKIYCEIDRVKEECKNKVFVNYKNQKIETNEIVYYIEDEGFDPDLKPDYPEWIKPPSGEVIEKPTGPQIKPGKPSGSEDNTQNNKPSDNKDNNDSNDNNSNNSNNSNNNSSSNNNSNSNTGNITNDNKTYGVSGIAWYDENKNGQYDTGEKLLKSICAMAIDTSTNKLLRDSSGNIVKVYTNENGQYSIANIPSGNYIIVFEFNTSEYSVTTYNKEGVAEANNSNVILSNITVENLNGKYAITDKNQINSNLENINIGLIKNANFDLSIDKQISSVSVINKKGTSTKNYKNKKLAKVDLIAKYMNKTDVIVKYKFIVTNNGDVVGYVEKLKDIIPSGLEFNSEMNKDWYKDENGNICTTALSGIAIEPGKTTDIELTLTKSTTENTTGTFTNNVELEKTSNKEAIEEKNVENNKSSADLVISIKTGSMVMYIGITLTCFAVVTIGVIAIKKKIS